LLFPEFKQVEESKDRALIQTENENSFVSACMRAKDRARYSRKKKEDAWKEDYNFYMGDHWSGAPSVGIPARKPEVKRIRPSPVDNFIFSQIEGIRADLTDKPVDFQIKPTELGDEENAKALNDLCRHIFYLNKANKQFKKAARKMLKYGPVCAKVYWDNDWKSGYGKRRWVGNVRFFVFGAEHLLIDPKITEPDRFQDAEYIIYMTPRSLEYVRQKYPERGIYVKSDPTMIDVEIFGETDIDPYEQRVMVYEFWYKGKPLIKDFPEPKEEEVEDEEGIHCAVIADFILLKHESYVYKHGMYPFAFTTLYEDERSIYGFGEIHNLKNPQVVMNKVNEIALDNEDFVGRGNWLTSESNIRDKKRFALYASMAGSILPVTDVQKTVKIPGQNAPASVFTHYRQQQAAMETISGRFDITQGRAPRGVRAGYAIALLQQAAGGRTKDKADVLNDFISQILKLTLEYIKEFYTEARIYRILGQNNEIIGEGVFRNAQLLKIDESTGEEYIPDFDVEVSVGINTPISKAYIADLAVQLYGMQVIDRQAVLEAVDFPNWRNILARVEGKQAPGQASEQVPPELAAALQGAGMPQSRPAATGLPQPPPAMPPEAQGLSPAFMQPTQYPSEIAEYRSEVTPEEEKLQMMQTRSPEVQEILKALPAHLANSLAKLSDQQIMQIIMEAIGGMGGGRISL